MFKALLTILIIILLFLQYRLWIEHDGLQDTLKLNKAISAQQKQNEAILQRNKALIAEMKNLKHGDQSIEDRAREELGMIKKGEQFYQIVQPNNSNSKVVS